MNPLNSIINITGMLRRKTKDILRKENDRESVSSDSQSICQFSESEESDSEDPLKS